MSKSSFPPADIVQALLSSPHFQFRDTPGYLRDGICPNCRQKTLYIGKEHPYVIRCNRANKCGYEETVREAMPELFEQFLEKHPVTPENRQATADAYMGLNRGFDLSKIHDWYEQGFYQTGGKFGLPTVRFYLDPTKTRYWERFIEGSGPKGAKAVFGGKRKDDDTMYQGDVWSPPGFNLEKGDHCYITEGIFHAIALTHAGYKAVAALSCGHYPSTFIQAHSKRQIRWIWAMDSDVAGRKGMKQHHKRLKQAGELSSVCLTPASKDWDDLWREEKITETNLKKWKYHGQLFLAETVEEKAFYYYRHNRYNSFILDFGNALYSIELSSAFQLEINTIANKDLEEIAMETAREKKEQAKEKKGKQEKAEAEAASKQDEPAAKEETPVKPFAERHDDPIDLLWSTQEGKDLFIRCCLIDQIANVLPTFLYMERDEVMDEQRYVFSIEYSNGQQKDLIALSGGDITSPDSFHKALLNRSRGGTFDGSPKQLKRLRDRWLNSRMTTITALPFVGYEPESKAYIFQHHAWHNGRKIPINEHGYFNIQRRGLKTVLNGAYINTDGKFNPNWIKDFGKAFHLQGLCTLSFWLGSLFARQIRDLHSTFPFFELTGEPGSGKSTLLEFLWKCTGRDEYEGFDLLKSSAAGRRRSFSQVSNLPIVIIESDRDSGDKDAKQKQFGFDELKPFYNGRSTGTLGVATRSNDTDEPPFQASILISQNAEVDGSEALLSRIVHCHADKAHHKPGSKELARWFERQNSDEVGGFLNAALSRERQILERYQEAFDTYEKLFTPSLNNARIIKNHAQIAACAAALDIIFPEITPKTQDAIGAYLMERATVRERRIAFDHPLVEQFWDTYDYINSQTPNTVHTGDFLNHASEDKPFIAINFQQFIELCRSHGQPIPDIILLKKLLHASQKRKLIESNKCITSYLWKKNTKCWIFEKK